MRKSAKKKAVKKSKVSKARAKQKRVQKSAKLGSGKRFSALSKSIQAEGKSKKSADAIAAAVGRKKYGKKKMAKLSAKGRKK